MFHFNVTLILMLVSFIIFMVLMKAIYFDPMLKIRAEREQKLTDDQKSADQFVEDFERIFAEYQATLQNARKEAHTLIQELRLKSKASAHETLQQARSEAQAESDRQMADLHQWRETTYLQLKDERHTLSQAIIGKITSGRKVRTAFGG